MKFRFDPNLDCQINTVQAVVCLFEAALSSEHFESFEDYLRPVALRPPRRAVR